MDGRHEPIIDLDTWTAVQERMKLQKEKYCKYLISEIEKLKEELAHSEQSQTEKNESVVIDKEKSARLIDILKDESVNNSEKNKIARIVFKEIVKGGQDGKTIKCVFWE